MRILAISDSHGDVLYLKSVIKKSGMVFDRCIHMGDVVGQEEEIKKVLGIPVDFVRGNCDMFSKLPDNLCLKIGKHNCLLTHGHLYHAKSSMDGLVRAAKETGADMVFFGHTHKPCILEIDGITLMNPGSISRPYGNRPGYAVIDVDYDGEIQLSLCEV